MKKCISPEEIEAGKSPAGGFTRNTLASWGVSWPPRAGWRKRLNADYARQNGLEIPQFKEPLPRSEWLEKQWQWKNSGKPTLKDFHDRLEDGVAWPNPRKVTCDQG